MQVTIDTVEHNLLLGMALVLIVLIFFLVSVRAAIIVALTIPLSLLFSFIFLHARGIPANLLSIGAIDFGIIIDGTVVMMENIHRELAVRHGQEYKLHEVIIAAAHDVDRPIFYSIAVILAGYIPIYALSGPSGKLFHPMAETMSWALLGSLIFTLTFVPVLASYWFTQGREGKDEPRLRMAEGRVRFGAPLVPGPPESYDGAGHDHFRCVAASGSFHRRRVHAAPRRRSDVGSRHHALHHLLRGGGEVRSADPQDPDVLPDGHRSWLGAGASRRRHRPHRILQLRVLRRAEALQGRNLDARDRSTTRPS